jgi:hypothetical protein
MKRRWTSPDKRTKSLQENLADTRKDLHEELGLMLQVETQTTKFLTEATRSEFQTLLKEVEARPEGERRIGTGAGAAKPHKSTGRHHGPCSGASSRP